MNEFELDEKTTLKTWTIMETLVWRRRLPRGTDHLFLCLTDDLILFQVVVPCSPNSFTF